MDKVYPLSTPMDIQSRKVNKDPFQPLEEDEELLGPEILYLGVDGALIYLANANKSGADHIGNAGYLSDTHKVRFQTGKQGMHMIEISDSFEKHVGWNVIKDPQYYTETIFHA